MNGLMRTSAATTSLLLNVEAVATALIAWIVFREHASRRTIAGMLLIVLGAVILGWNRTPAAGSLIGPLVIIAACVASGIDNNLTRNISSGDAVEIALVKTFVGGAVNTTLAFVVLHSHVPKPTIVAGAAIVGFFGYGLSLVLYIVAMRHLGTARTGAYFSTAPFIGAVIAVAVGSALTDWRFLLSAALMGAGVLLHLTERHAHAHFHERTEHEHAHLHDAHHQHEHTAVDPPGEPHTHRHVHETLAHSHEHFPDTHHRHSHE